LILDGFSRKTSSPSSSKAKSVFRDTISWRKRVITVSLFAIAFFALAFVGVSVFLYLDHTSHPFMIFGLTDSLAALACVFLLRHELNNGGEVSVWMKVFWGLSALIHVKLCESYVLLILESFEYFYVIAICFYSVVALLISLSWFVVTRSNRRMSVSIDDSKFLYQPVAVNAGEVKMEAENWSKWIAEESPLSNHLHIALHEDPLRITKVAVPSWIEKVDGQGTHVCFSIKLRSPELGIWTVWKKFVEISLFYDRLCVDESMHKKIPGFPAPHANYDLYRQELDEWFRILVTVPETQDLLCELVGFDDRVRKIPSSNSKPSSQAGSKPSSRQSSRHSSVIISPEELKEGNTDSYNITDDDDVVQISALSETIIVATEYPKERPLVIDNPKSDIVSVRADDIELYKPAQGRKFASFRFVVNSFSSCWTVTKRYSDFVDLHAKIIREVEDASKASLPQLPKKSIMFSSQFLKERFQELEIYLQGLVSTPRFRTPALELFLAENQPSPSYPDCELISPTIQRQPTVSFPRRDSHEDERKSVNVYDELSDDIKSPEESRQPTLSPQSDLHRYAAFILGYETAVENNKSHIVYDIEVREYFAGNEYLLWGIKKRFKDFRKLRDGLKGKFPARAIPELPSKKFHVDDKTLQSRKENLEIFLQKIVNISEFNKCEEVHAFIELDNPSREIHVKHYNALM